MTGQRSFKNTPVTAVGVSYNTHTGSRALVGVRLTFLGVVSWGALSITSRVDATGAGRGPKGVGILQELCGKLACKKSNDTSAV